MNKKILITMLLAAAITLTGCGNSAPDTGNASQTQNSDAAAASSGSSQNTSSAAQTSNAPADGQPPKLDGQTLNVRFGSAGSPFTLYLYDNTTAAAIARHVGTADWQLPIYHYDDYTGWENFQYYDVPSRYEIPSNTENITQAKCGEVYYSEPNRIVLFYHDAEISSEYSRVGYFEPTDEFVSAVENNPVLEGWGNKLVLIQKAD